MSLFAETYSPKDRRLASAHDDSSFAVAGYSKPLSCSVVIFAVCGKGELKCIGCSSKLDNQTGMKRRIFHELKAVFTELCEDLTSAMLARSHLQGAYHQS